MCTMQPWPIHLLVPSSSLPPSQQGSEQKTCHPNSSCHEAMHKPTTQPSWCPTEDVPTRGKGTWVIPHVYWDTHSWSVLGSVSRA